MASGIQRDIGAGARVIGAVADQELIAEQMRRVGLSPTQVELNRLYSYFRTQQHESCAVAWDGSPQLDALSRESVASTAVLPPGYQDVGGNLNPLPLRYRKPSAPCHLCMVIVGRFTDLLFSEQQSPSWKVQGDPATESWVSAVTRHFGLWSTLAQVRNLGGAMGTAIVGFKIIDGEVVFECFDRRWCFPTWNPRKPGELAKLEIRYMYPKEERDPETGVWKEEKYWYRRTIDDQVDCLWAPQPVGDGLQEPAWENPTTIADGGWVNHNFGFVPIVWIPNIPVTDDIDGDPDCHGCYDYFDRIGELDSQAHKGALKNADPTPVVASDGNFDRITLGSDSAAKLEKGGSVTYLETSGTSIKTASEQSDRLQAKALQTASCVLPDREAAEGGPVTATEITKRTASMFAKASKLREQYGNRGAVKLMQKLIMAARKLSIGVTSDSGTIVKQAISLPAKVVDGKLAPEGIGAVSGASLELVWPPFSQPTTADTLQKVQATVQARAGRVITQETGVRHVASDFNVDNPKAELELLKQEPPPGGDLAAMSLQELNEGR